MINNNEIPETYVINLDSSVKRYHRFETSFNNAGINFKRFSAINGYKIQITDLENNQTFFGIELKGKTTNKSITYHIECTPDNKQIDFYFHNREMTAGEFGIWCSYLAIWKEAIAKDIEKLLIFEDDVYPKDIKTLKKSLGLMIANIPESFDVAFLNPNKIVQGHKIALENNNYIAKVSDDFKAYGSSAMVINSKAMKKLLSYSEYTGVIDCFIWSESNIKQLESYIIANENILNLGGLGSDIQIMR